jgi:hypothetical protein
LDGPYVESKIIAAIQFGIFFFSSRLFPADVQKTGMYRTWSLTLKEEFGYRMSESRVLRGRIKRRLENVT